MDEADLAAVTLTSASTSASTSTTTSVSTTMTVTVNVPPVDDAAPLVSVAEPCLETDTATNNNEEKEGAAAAEMEDNANNNNNDDEDHIVVATPPSPPILSPPPVSVQSHLTFRQVIPTDINACFEIERASYPRDEAATKSALQYRQHFAEKYFRCCVLSVVTEHEDDDEEEEEHHNEIVGFVCATRCRLFTEEAMATHDATGPLLAIHSVVVAEPYRRDGIATAMMKNYIETMEAMPDGVDKFVVIAKEELLGFYVKCGFSVLRPSDIVHGKELWFHLERPKEVGIPCWVVDAFAECPGEGNPAAVVLLPKEPEDRPWCQRVAQEFNLSETAFIWKWEAHENDEDEYKKSPSVHYGIRYYTCNGTEVDLCGHATLASAAVLFQTMVYPSITFHSNLEQLIMTPAKYGTSKKMQVSMNFPQKEVFDTDINRAVIVDMLQRTFPKISDRIEANIVFAGLDQDGNDLLVEVTPALFQDIGHDEGDVLYSSLLDWDGYRRGIIICSLTDDDVDVDLDFVSRFFGPKCGIPEDPVTGSAHCVLAPYFAQKLGKSELKAEQRSRRGGRIVCTLENYRVTILGSAIITMNGNCWI